MKEKSGGEDVPVMTDFQIDKVSGDLYVVIQLQASP